MVLELLCLVVWGTCALVSVLKTGLSHSRGSSVGVLKGHCRSHSRGELLKRQPWPPPTVWFSLGTTKVEWSASSWSCRQVTTFISCVLQEVGAWHAFSTPIGPRLCLRSFSCCLGARLRDLTFDVDPRDPRRMIDGTGRVLYCKGKLENAIHRTQPASPPSGYHGRG